jgi:hypothetical protein
MYNVVFTTGNDERIIKQFDNLSDAKAEKIRLEKESEYSNGLLTVEQKTKNGITIF